jgi:hypothetical protein
MIRTLSAGVLLVAFAVAPADARPVIRDGKAQRITAGDVVVIPIGTPHTFSEIERTLVFLNIRINPMKQ